MGTKPSGFEFSRNESGINKKSLAAFKFNC